MPLLCFYTFKTNVEILRLSGVSGPFSVLGLQSITVLSCEDNLLPLDLCFSELKVLEACGIP